MKVVEHESGWIIVDCEPGLPASKTRCYWTGKRWSIKIAQALIYPTPADAEADMPSLPPPPG